MINTTLCYIEKDGCYLMMHRIKKKNDACAGKWVGIGGKFEEGESPEDCLKREVFEETGLTLSSFQYRGLVTFVSNELGTEFMHIFTADKFYGEIQNCNEGELFWVPKDEVLNLNLWEGDKVFFALLKNNEPFFSLKMIYNNDKLIYAEKNGISFDYKKYII